MIAPRGVIRWIGPVWLLAGTLAAGTAGAQGRVPAASADSVQARFINADLTAVFQALGRHLPKPLLMTGVVPTRITIDHPAPIHRASVPELLRGIASAQGLELKEEAAFFHIGPRAPAPVVPQETRTQSAAIELFVLRLKHARAADVAATVNLLFGGSGEFSGRSGFSTGTLSEELRRNVVPPGLPTREPGAASAGDTRNRPAALSGQVTIVPDELTNALLIRAGREDYAVIESVVQDLDIRPLQVLIEVLIVEARRDRDFSLGGLIEAERQDGGNRYSARAGSGGVGDLVIGFMRMGRTEINAILNAAQSRGDVEIVSRPVILTSNNTEARLLVGSQRPFVQVSRSLPTDSPSRDEVVQYRDVGTKLTVRPTINQDGYVSLLIQQEISAATTEIQFNAPVIATREARTQVLVRDSQTIVLGGLNDHQRERQSSGVPILSSIPVIGGLFGSSSRRSTSTELFLFLTPRIIRSDEDADSLTAVRMPKVKAPHD